MLKNPPTIMFSLLNNLVKSSRKSIISGHRFCYNSSSNVSDSNVSSSNVSSSNVEKLFIQSSVQERLKKLTGFDDKVIFNQRPIPSHEAPRYMFMTPEDLQMSQERATKRGKKALEMVPYLNPIEDKVDILSIDPEIQGFEKHNIVFTDISHGAIDKNRLIVVREPNGILRRANREERSRMNQVYFPQEDRSHVVPKMFEEEHLQAVLDRNDYLFIMERSCLQFEPEDAIFVITSHKVYETVNERSHFDALRSTRFYGSMVFHLVIKKSIDNLLLHYLKKGSLEDGKQLVELYNIVHGIKSSVHGIKSPVDGIKSPVDGQGQQEPFDVIEHYIHNQSKSHTLLTTLKSLQEQLDGEVDQESSASS